MKKQFIFKSPNLFFVAIIMLLALVSTNNSFAAQTDNLNPTANTSLIVAPLQANLNGYLDILWVDAATFNSLRKKKLTFRFYINSSNSITLHGWYGRITRFINDAPDVKLSNGNPSQTIQYGPGDYFGNLIIYKKDIKKIKKLIKASSSLYVLFVPLDPAANDGQISYDIQLTKDDPHPSAKFTLATVPTGITTNPSPPRNGN